MKFTLTICFLVLISYSRSLAFMAADSTLAADKPAFLYQNNPNPFNPTTEIRYVIARSTHVKISVFNLVGRKIAILVDEKQEPQEYRVIFDASEFNAGVYLYQLETNEYMTTKRMILLK